MTISSVSINSSFFAPSSAMPNFGLLNQAKSGVGFQVSGDKSQEIKQQQEIRQLKDRDREVKAHEQAHLSAAGGLATGSAHFTYVTGPDGQRYATGGDVGIDVSEVPNDPQATLRKAETIRRAAMAPAQPSGQDYSVAGKAAAMAAKAAMQLLETNQGNQGRLGGRLDIKA